MAESLLILLLPLQHLFHQQGCLSLHLMMAAKQHPAVSAPHSTLLELVSSILDSRHPQELQKLDPSEASRFERLQGSQRFTALPLILRYFVNTKTRRYDPKMCKVRF